MLAQICEISYRLTGQVLLVGDSYTRVENGYIGLFKRDCKQDYKMVLKMQWGRHHLGRDVHYL